MTLFKLKKDGKTVGYLKIERGFLLGSVDGKRFTFVIEQNASGGLYLYSDIDRPYIDFDIAHPFVCLDKNGKDVFAKQEVLVYRGKKNIGEGYVDFNERFLWWVVNNSNQDSDRESPQDWSQLNLCDVEIELIEAPKNV